VVLKNSSGPTVSTPGVAAFTGSLPASRSSWTVTGPGDGWREVDRELNRLPLLSVLTVHDQVGLVVVGDGGVVRVERVGGGAAHDRGLELDELDALDPRRRRPWRRGPGSRFDPAAKVRSPVTAVHCWVTTLKYSSAVAVSTPGVAASTGSVPGNNASLTGDGGGRRLGQVDGELAGLAFHRVLAEHDQEGQGRREGAVRSGGWRGAQELVGSVAARGR
jgi:hypothetical protein